MVTKIVDITAKNFDDIPRPANRRFNCQECFYWMGKKDGRTNLCKQKKNWFVRTAKEYNGSLGKLLLWGKREKPVGFIQFGPILEFQTAQIFYRNPNLGKDADSRQNSDDKEEERPPLPRNGWCIVCVAIQSGYRGKGLATRLIRNVLRDLKRRGVRVVDAYPLKGKNAWNQVPVGPVKLWEKCHFKPLVEINLNRRKTKTKKKKPKRILMRKKW